MNKEPIELVDEDRYILIDRLLLIDFLKEYKKQSKTKEPFFSFTDYFSLEILKNFNNNEKLNIVDLTVSSYIQEKFYELFKEKYNDQLIELKRDYIEIFNNTCKSLAIKWIEINIFNENKEVASSNKDDYSFDLKQNFILSDIEYKERDGKIYTVQYINVHDKKIPIMGLISNIFPDLIEFNSLRPSIFKQSNDLISINAKIEEYHDDFRKLYYFISKHSDINESVVIKAFKKRIEIHIKDNGRLIDTDLYTYIDYAVMVKNTLWFKFFNERLTNERMFEFWNTLKKLGFEEYHDFIFITKYDVSNISNPVPILIKLTNVE